MAIPKTLTAITEAEAKKIISKHPEGRWEGEAFNSDFVYEGRMTKYGYRRYEMVRAFNICGMVNYEKGVVSL